MYFFLLRAHVVKHSLIMKIMPINIKKQKNAHSHLISQITQEKRGRVTPSNKLSHLLSSTIHTLWFESADNWRGTAVTELVTDLTPALPAALLPGGVDSIISISSSLSISRLVSVVLATENLLLRSDR